MYVDNRSHRQAYGTRVVPNFQKIDGTHRNSPVQLQERRERLERTAADSCHCHWQRTCATLCFQKIP